ncbi:MAG: hypothetical protein R8G66_26115 [Cytophagales bacterium]|nr:hypothetical protein [Cytophagales bacterium]
MNDDQLNDEQLKQLKLYFQTLDEIRGIDQSGFWTDEELRELTSIYRLIGKLGDGNPVKAAHMHTRTIRGANRAIELTNGDQSTAIH